MSIHTHDTSISSSSSSLSSSPFSSSSYSVFQNAKTLSGPGAKFIQFVALDGKTLFTDLNLLQHFGQLEGRYGNAIVDAIKAIEKADKETQQQCKATLCELVSGFFNIFRNFVSNDRVQGVASSEMQCQRLLDADRFNDLRDAIKNSIDVEKNMVTGRQISIEQFSCLTAFAGLAQNLKFMFNDLEKVQHDNDKSRNAFNIRLERYKSMFDRTMTEIDTSGQLDESALGRHLLNLSDILEVLKELVGCVENKVNDQRDTRNAFYGSALMSFFQTGFSLWKGYMLSGSLSSLRWMAGSAILNTAAGVSNVYLGYVYSAEYNKFIEVLKAANACLMLAEDAMKAKEKKPKQA